MRGVMEEVTFVFDGDVEALITQMQQKISELCGEAAVFCVSIPAATKKMPGAPGCLQVFRKLVRLSPYAVICDISVNALQPLDVILALTCDMVRSEKRGVKLAAVPNDELLASAKHHWQFYTGETLGQHAVLNFSNLVSDVKPLAENLADFLPHYWYAFRNVGMAAGIFMPSLQEGKDIEASEVQLTKPGEQVARLKGIFNFYFGPKIASIFAAADQLNQTGGATSFARQVDAYRAQLQEAESNPERMKRALDNAFKTNRATVDTVEITLTSDILYADLGAIKLIHVVKDPNVKTISIRLEDGILTDAGSILPKEREQHILIYKWHRKWEQLLGLVLTKKVVCTLAGVQICPPLLELFFAAEDRIWASPSKSIVWCKVPFAYSPGPEALQGGLRGLPISAVRRLLTTGLDITEAIAYNLVKRQDPGRPQKPTIPNVHASALVGGSVDRAAFAAKKHKTQDLTSGTSPDMSYWLWGGGRLGLPEQTPNTKHQATLGSCSLLGYGLAVPEEYKATQAEIATMLGVTKDNRRDWSILTASHIKTRYLAELAADLKDPEKIDLTHNNAKHLRWATKMLVEAIKKACDDAGISPKQVAHVTVSTSTGYLLPGLTAYVVKDESLGIPKTACREDVVGMGCHAGLNSMKSAASWACANPGKYAISCGVEVCSAQYVWGNSTRKQLNTVIVNSLFGDGCFCAVLRSAPAGETNPPPAYIDLPPQWWTQLCDTDALDDMIYNVEESEDKYRFDLSELAPYHVGQGLFSMMQYAFHANIPVHEARHVVTHTGGKTVLDCSAVALGLEGVPSQSLPYTVQALRDYGNQSSVSILFAFNNLVKSGDVCEGDNGLLITMGPGAGLEMAMFTAGKRFPVRSNQQQVMRKTSGLVTLESLMKQAESRDFQEEEWIFSEADNEKEAVCSVTKDTKDAREAKVSATSTAAGGAVTHGAPCRAGSTQSFLSCFAWCRN
eukprot:TRINITY_DN1074_c0_g1_i3.p1 TRINITY_DN1074_c0_g1~~TRINITY_DN1074_c0_g1_i3.p1  ORF type:complete len:960 (-),score=206.23 TRINITY_DN1074_c0_g1_i3:367-3246(-)